jgi:hypothetical protein
MDFCGRFRMCEMIVRVDYVLKGALQNYQIHPYLGLSVETESKAKKKTTYSGVLSN